jgi:hypothetical protein
MINGLCVTVVVRIFLVGVITVLDVVWAITICAFDATTNLVSRVSCLNHH